MSKSKLAVYSAPVILGFISGLVCRGALANTLFLKVVALVGVSAALVVQAGVFCLSF